ncbi:alkaline phosphatase PafA [Flavobacterium aurantiibacter]|uniref:alkaline phosphatase PafA n=1 Tax=Flavobacterium aurantiibacter TaxID=2023067 RepID=UPI001FAFA108|nr:alkaline phosphatase PafA [Flavobacterium aurantiibacter]
MSHKFHSKPFVWALLLVTTFFSAKAQDRPKLVVGIVVDQMKTEYLYRFANDFGSGGFKRLTSNGFTFYNAHFNYMPTYTGPGHASVYTGTTPRFHGIVGNDWYNKSIKKNMYCTDDASVRTLGAGDEAEGKMSPKNLKATTITDELKLSTNFRGKVIGMSMKDRGAILPAGHFADCAFWYSKTGAFISSTFYRNELPAWATKFNDEKHFLKYVQNDWNPLKPLAQYDESLADENPYEGKIFKANTATFPYDLKSMYEKSGAQILRALPFGNDLLTDFALAAIDAEQLGKDNHTDFLAISYSATDYVGHITGPRSIELQDTYVRLDASLEKLLKYLDEKVGKGQYLVFLTADHAGAENPVFLKDHKYEVENVSSKDFVNKLEAFGLATFGEDVIANCSNQNIFFDKDALAGTGISLTDAKNKVRDFVMKESWVLRVYTEEEILASSGSDPYLQLIANGYDTKQNGELVILESPGTLEDHTTGTTHGSVFSYDTHVPIIFFGKGITAGKSHEKCVTTEIAPTLAQLLQLSLPNATNAEVLEALFKN